VWGQEKSFFPPHKSKKAVWAKTTVKIWLNRNKGLLASFQLGSLFSMHHKSAFILNNSGNILFGAIHSIFQIPKPSPK